MNSVPVSQEHSNSAPIRRWITVAAMGLFILRDRSDVSDMSDKAKYAH